MLTYCDFLCINTWCIFLQEAYCHCGQTENCTIIDDAKHFYRIKPNTVKTMKVGLAKYGPISCSINADAKTLRFYSKGMYNDPDYSSKEIININFEQKQFTLYALHLES